MLPLIWILGLRILRVLTQLLTETKLSKCFRWASVFQRMLSFELKFLRFQEFIEYRKYDYIKPIYRLIIINRMAEEQQKIQKYIIKSTPYGELPEALKDLEKLAPLDPSAPLISTALQEYNEDHLAIFPIQGGAQTHYPLMSICRLEPFRYIDQQEKKIYTVDHLKGTVSSSQDHDPQLIDSVQELLTCLSSSVAKYTSTYYKEPCASTVFMNLTEESLDVHIGITSKNVQLNNFVTGEWISRWVVRKGEIQGNISINSHFFESGNVQFHQKRSIKKEFQFEESMPENAKNIAKIIEQAEGEIQSNLNDLYEEMPNTFFKHLRRITPLTKTKMVWNINAIKMNRNLMGMNK